LPISISKDVLLNNWYNDDIVRPIKLIEYGTSVDNETGILNNHTPSMLITLNANKTKDDPNGTPILIYGKRSNHNIGSDILPASYAADDLKNKIPIWSPYIKVNYGRSNDPTTTLIYRIVGYTSEENKNNKVKSFYPIYGLTNKNGMKYHGHTIVEYGQ